MKTLILAIMITVSSQAFGQSANASISSSNTANVAITSSDRDYSLIARFDAAKSPKILKLLTSELGVPTDQKGDLSVWLLPNMYTVTLHAEKLVIDLDKKNVDESLVGKFEKFGKKISAIITNTKG